MGENNTIFCPFYRNNLDIDDCYDRYLIASGLFKDEKVVKEKERKELYKSCLKCGNYKN